MCFEWAGIVGVNPDPFTLAELRMMSLGKQRDEWDRASSIVCSICNVIRAFQKNAKPFDPLDFHPLRRKPTQKPIPITMEQVKQILFPNV